MGVFSGSGVGKSVMLGMMARYSAADVIVGEPAPDVTLTAADGALMESVQHLVARYGVLDLFAGLKPGEEIIGIDERFVHYQ